MEHSKCVVQFYCMFYVTVLKSVMKSTWWMQSLISPKEQHLSILSFVVNLEKYSTIWWFYYKEIPNIRASALYCKPHMWFGFVCVLWLLLPLFRNIYAYLHVLLFFEQVFFGVVDVLLAGLFQNRKTHRSLLWILCIALHFLQEHLYE